MSFSVEINDKEILPVIYLSNEKESTSAEIYAFGALLNSFTISNSINLIDGFSSVQDAKNNIINSFKSAKLSPFVCRIDKGKYIFNGIEYKLNKFFLGEQALHGLLFDAVFEIADYGANNNAAFVQLQYDYRKQNEGFPFNYRCIICYSLEKNNTIAIKTCIKNISDEYLPVCDGWHPYFTLGANINELSFQLNADTMLEFNERLVPTGKILPYKKFRQLEIFGETFLDNCFLLKENNKPACILRNNQSGLQLTVHADKSYPYLQIFTPDHRNSIAIENLSAAPDAFNNKVGLRILKPGESCFFKTMYNVSVSL